MPRVNRDLKLYYKCAAQIHTYSVQIAEVLTSDNRIRVPPPGSHIQTTQGQTVRSCLHVRGVISGEGAGVSGPQGFAIHFFM